MKYFLGVTEGVCQLCGEHKKVVLMRGGLNLCTDCLDIMAFILEHADKGISEEDLKRLLKTSL